mmetsp:Transcript_26765/g.86673  ORF Transcript_26765/g.86673 Transcript_26765/m.86673 type:complete len:164 (+) Transcript_26765:1-492(+)
MELRLRSRDDDDDQDQDDQKKDNQVLRHDDDDFLPPLHFLLAGCHPYLSDLEETINCLVACFPRRRTFKLDIRIGVALFTSAEGVTFFETDLDTDNIAHALSKLADLESESIVVGLDADVPGLDYNRLHHILQAKGITVRKDWWGNYRNSPERETLTDDNEAS